MTKIKLYFTIIAALIVLPMAAQKVKIKDGKVNVDKALFLNIKEDKISKGNYILMNQNNEELFYLRSNRYIDPKEISKYNTDGDVFYFEVLSADLETIYFENRPTGCLMGCHVAENVVTQLYNGEAVNADGTANPAKLNMLSKKIGFEYSKKRDELNGGSGSNTIIINEEPRRSGININLGR